jgi:peptide chain release factor 1
MPPSLSPSAPWTCLSCLVRRSPSSSSIRQPRIASRVVVQRRFASNNTKLHPALLARARTLAAEHADVARAIADAYSAPLASRLSTLSPIAGALAALDAAHASVADLQSMLSSSDAELRALAADELASTTTSLQALTRTLEEALMPKPQYAEMPCLIEIMPGPGGVEGKLFADALFRMYKAYLSSEGIPHSVVKYETSDAAGGVSGHDGESPLLEAVLEVTCEGGYGRFRTEAGMHRVQRVPSTEKQGRIHTSAVAVWVLPSFPDFGPASDAMASLDDPTSDFYLNPAEVRVEGMRARGAGGQHVNKTESAVRLTHMPTGTVVAMQDHRSKGKNSEAAWRLLRARVATQRREAREEEAAKLRDGVLAKDKLTRGDKVRTYNFPQDRCTDHRSGVTVHNLPDVMVGGSGLGKIMGSVSAWLVDRDVQAMVREEEAKVAALEGGDAKADGKGKARARA